MVAELKEVISKVEQLDDEEQKRIAKLLEEELKWDNNLQNTHDGLVDLAQEALAEYKMSDTGKYDEEYLKGLRDKAKKSWLEKINPEEWLREVRGSYE
jgi:hypothetical protein